MGRYRFTAYQNDTQPRYVVVWGLQWQILDCRRLKPTADLSAAMAATLERLDHEKVGRPKAARNTALCSSAVRMNAGC